MYFTLYRISVRYTECLQNYFTKLINLLSVSSLFVSKLMRYGITPFLYDIK